MKHWQRRVAEQSKVPFSFEMGGGSICRYLKGKHSSWHNDEIVFVKAAAETAVVAAKQRMKFNRNKIEGTPILKLAKVKRFKVL
jgi:hypothetical protein